jgi:hypothetical protein
VSRVVHSSDAALRAGAGGTGAAGGAGARGAAGAAAEEGSACTAWQLARASARAGAHAAVTMPWAETWRAGTT